MIDSEAGMPNGPVRLVQWLYDTVHRVDMQSFTSMVWPGAGWQAGGRRGCGGPEMFAVLLDLIERGRLTVYQVVAQGATVIVLGTVQTHGLPQPSDFVHVWLIEDGHVARLRMFTQCYAIGPPAHARDRCHRIARFDCQRGRDPRVRAATTRNRPDSNRGAER